MRINYQQISKKKIKQQLSCKYSGGDLSFWKKLKPNLLIFQNPNEFLNFVYVFEIFLKFLKIERNVMNFKHVFVTKFPQMH